MKVAAILVLSVLAGAALTAVGGEVPTNVSLIQLIANAEKYDGKLVQIQGYLRIDFEGTAVYLHREDYQNGLTKNGLWANVSLAPEQMKFDQQYVLIEGIFDAHNKGHLGLWSGAIKDLKRVDLWPPAATSAQACWRDILLALKEGDEKQLAALTTEKGLKSLQFAGMTPEAKKAWMKQLIENFSELRWFPIKSGTQTATQIQAMPAMTGFRFMWTQQGWKLDALLPGQ